MFSVVILKYLILWANSRNKVHFKWYDKVSKSTFHFHHLFLRMNSQSQQYTNTRAYTFNACVFGIEKSIHGCWVNGLYIYYLTFFESSMNAVKKMCALDHCLNWNLIPNLSSASYMQIMESLLWVRDVFRFF